MEKELNERVLAKVRYYEKYYTPTEPIFLSKLGEEVVIRSGNPGVCKFCGRTAQDVTFKKKAHALSELLGNKSLFSLNECDDCNLKFSLFESHLASYLGVKRTLSLMDGKRGIPKFLSRDQRSKVHVKDGVLKIDAVEGSGFATIDKEKKHVVISTLSDPFIPRFAYKALVKMALSLMPEEEMSHFAKTLEWLQNDKVEGEKIVTSSLVCLKSFAPGHNPLKSITVMLFKRKDPTAFVPYTSFLLAFNNYTFQIFLPFSDMDEHLRGKQLEIAYFPNPIDAIPDGPVVKYETENLSSMTVVKRRKNNMIMGYKEIFEKKVEKFAEAGQKDSGSEGQELGTAKDES